MRRSISLPARSRRTASGAYRKFRAQRGRRTPARHILILVNRRGTLFEAIIRALKNASIPVAGADRLVLTEHIAVMDLLVLADALLLPQMTCTCTTQEPLFGFDEGIFCACLERGENSLRAALKQKSADNKKFAETSARLDALSLRAHNKSPFEFYAQLLGAKRGRERFLARLGHEASDALDEFLNLALEFERGETPSLQGFVDWMRAAKSEIKRDMEMVRNEVRVMTVHGPRAEARSVLWLTPRRDRKDITHRCFTTGTKRSSAARLGERRKGRRRADDRRASRSAHADATRKSAAALCRDDTRG